jgi:ATP-dependent DNA ligase
MQTEKLNKPYQLDWSKLKKIKDLDNFIAEPKFDGERAMLVNTVSLVKSKTVPSFCVMRDNNRVKNVNYPELLDIKLPENTVLDGEVCIPTSDYTSLFNNFQSRMNLLDSNKISQYIKQPNYKVSFVAFDVLTYKGESVEHKPWKERRKILESIKENSQLKIIKYYKPEELKVKVQALGMEGVVLKNVNSSYNSKWYKIKNLVERDFKVTGYTTSDKRLISTIEIEDMENGDPMGSVTYYGPNFPQTLEAANMLKGKIAVVQYLESGSKSKPRFPVLKELR